MRTSTWHFFALCSCLLFRRERTMRYDTICLNIRSFRHVLQWVMELHAVPASGGLRLCRSFSLSRQRWSRLKTKKAHGAVRHRPGTFATYGRGRESAVAIGLRRRFAVCTCNVSWRPTGWRTVGHCAIMVSLHLGLKNTILWTWGFEGRPETDCKTNPTPTGSHLGLCHLAQFQKADPDGRHFSRRLLRRVFPKEQLPRSST